jgi:hypothetical protein
MRLYIQKSKLEELFGEPFDLDDEPDDGMEARIRESEARLAQPILDALRACVTGEFAKWSNERHESLGLWIRNYPGAVANAAALFLDEHAREPVKVLLLAMDRGTDTSLTQ